MKLEICTGSIESVYAAFRGGADRVELCSGLEEGGLTPSYGLIRKAANLAREYEKQVHVLIRPRGGDFLYSQDEKQIIAEDIQMAVDCGVDGVVIGALDAYGNIDVEACSDWIAVGGSVSFTFHRAFDVCKEPFKALEQIIALGFHRILTSGQALTAELGISLIKELVNRANNHLIIMPGCGVTSTNAAKIMQMTGAKEIHASAKREVKSRMLYRKEGVEMGSADRDEYLRNETNQDYVRAIKRNILVE